ncbi:MULTISPECIES: hypothetical protein [Reichenbachiella]|uniref:hypothetical protein n=1 Tax=Reichenbachiella TaxID=156993 RepID=UPI000E6B8E62|nr:MULTISPECIES: hypothetical protein [Reichenbachiella]MBU2915387.1 hypothetical protein [Reichenbachiella agariperforans]RJE71542.1 hypothetical protein BGP76_05455 [Reichenbachiella sp. MSK19-1]
MKAATVRELKQVLKEKSETELMELCLQLSRFKKENKELLTYLLYEAQDEASYIESVKLEMDELFAEINNASYYYINKSARKILRLTKKYIRYSKKKETEVELLTYYCQSLIDFDPPLQRNTTLFNIYQRQMTAIRKSVATLHEDLQYDYTVILDRMV